MLTKKILSCIIAIVLVSTFSSFSIPHSPKQGVHSSLTVLKLYQRVTQGGINYNVYLHYDTIWGAVTGAEVYLDDCTNINVDSVIETGFMVNTSGTTWYASSQVYVQIGMVSLVIFGNFEEQNPSC